MMHIIDEVVLPLGRKGVEILKAAEELARIRKPLPVQTERRFKDKTKYTRKMKHKGGIHEIGQ